MQVMSLLCSFLFMLYDVLEHRVEEEAVSLPLLPAIDYIYDHYMEQIKWGSWLTRVISVRAISARFSRR